MLSGDFNAEDTESRREERVKRNKEENRETERAYRRDAEGAEIRRDT